MLVLRGFWLSVSSLLHQLCSSCRNASACVSGTPPVLISVYTCSHQNIRLSICVCVYPWMYLSIYQSIITQILKHSNIVKWGIPDSTLFSNSSGQGYQVSVMLLFRSGSLSPRESLNSQSVIFQIGKKTPFRINDCMSSRANEFGTPESCIQLSWIIVFHCSINWGEGTSCA